MARVYVFQSLNKEEKRRPDFCTAILRKKHFTFKNGVRTVVCGDLHRYGNQQLRHTPTNTAAPLREPESLFDLRWILNQNHNCLRLTCAGLAPASFFRPRPYPATYPACMSGVCVLVRGLSYLAADCCRRRPSSINVLLYYVARQGKASGLPRGETGPRDIQMIIPLHQLRIPHIQNLEQYLSPSTTNIWYSASSNSFPSFFASETYGCQGSIYGRLSPEILRALMCGRSLRARGASGSNNSWLHILHCWLLGAIFTGAKNRPTLGE